MKFGHSRLRSAITKSGPVPKVQAQGRAYLQIAEKLRRRLPPRTRKTEASIVAAAEAFSDAVDVGVVTLPPSSPLSSSEFYSADRLASLRSSLICLSTHLAHTGLRPCIQVRVLNQGRKARRSTGIADLGQLPARNSFAVALPGALGIFNAEDWLSRLNSGRVRLAFFVLCALLIDGPLHLAQYRGNDFRGIL